MSKTSSTHSSNEVPVKTSNRNLKSSVSPPVSFLDLLRRRQRDRERDVLHHNACQRQRALSISPANSGANTSSTVTPIPESASYLQGRTLSDEQVGKVRILDQMFQQLEWREAVELRQREEEHYRIHSKLLVSKGHIDEDSALLRRQFKCRMERKAYREEFPKLRRVSTLPSLQ
jgi:hypothetical protein